MLELYVQCSGAVDACTCVVQFFIFIINFCSNNSLLIMGVYVCVF